MSVNIETISMSEYFRHFVDEVRSSPLYVALCPLLAAHPLVAEMWTQARPTQRRPNLILAAVHASVLRDPADELGQWFATVGGNRSPNDPALATALDRFLIERHAEIATLVASGATQTNEVGRSAILRPALGLIHDEVRQPLGLVEIGCSAALNLRFDTYRITYNGRDVHAGAEQAADKQAADKQAGDAHAGDSENSPGAAGVSVGPDASSVHIVADVSRSVEPLSLTAMANTVIGSRRGGDLNPLDPADPTQARWLRSLIWPDEHERFNRLSNALLLAPSIPVDVTTGDAVDIVGALIDSVSESEHAVVLTTWVLTYLPEDRRVAFTAALQLAAAKRPVTWICVEHPFYCPGLPWPDDVATAFRPGTGRSDNGPSMLGNPLVVHRLDGSETVSRWIATVHPHGRWINWHPTAADSGAGSHAGSQTGS